MHSWRVAALVFASAFVLGLSGLLASTALARLYEPSRVLVVGSGSLLAGALVAGLWSALARQVRGPHLRDARPLVSMHPRRRS
jgi:hypothetical protein